MAYKEKLKEYNKKKYEENKNNLNLLRSWRLFLATCLWAAIISGCVMSSIRYSETDPNVPIEYKGNAADIKAQSEADNNKTAQGRTADMQKHNAWLYTCFVLGFVGGCCFWWFTRSRYGFVIPSACIAGLVLITVFASYAEYFALGVLVIGLGLLIWKAIEYQKERNRFIKGEKNE